MKLDSKELKNVVLAEDFTDEPMEIPEMPGKIRNVLFVQTLLRRVNNLVIALEKNTQSLHAL